MENKKTTSYLDWELSFKKDKSRNPHLDENIEKPNSMGIPPKELKDFLASWREENL